VVLPKVIYGPVTNETHTSGTLNASVDLKGGPEVTSCQFQYGTNTSYGSSVPCSPPTPYPSNTSISADVSSLTPETTYHYRVVLTTVNGTRNGADQTYTPRAVHGVATDPATSVTTTTVALNGSFLGEGEDVHYYFEWGAGSALGNRTAVPPGVLQATPIGEQDVSFSLSHLKPATAYSFRLVADDSFGTTIGSVQTFSTMGRNQFAAYYGSSGSGDGQLKEPSDVAVDNSTGDVYVADEGNHRVVRLDSSGNFLSAWGWGVGGGTGFEVCEVNCGSGIAGTDPGQLSKPVFIEVDNSSGPSRGDVYVADETRGDVQKFGPAGELVNTWGNKGAMDFAGDGPIEGITVDDQGALFVASTEVLPVSTEPHWTEIGQDGVFRQKISTARGEHYLGAPNGAGIDVGSLGTFYQASEYGGVNFAPPGLSDGVERDGTFGNPTGLAVNRGTGDLYVDHGAFVVQFLASDACFASNTTVGECVRADQFGVGKLNSARGIAFTPSTGTVYVANSGSDDIALFNPLPAPGVTTDGAESSDAVSATLRGHVKPFGSATITDCYFEYGTDSTLALGMLPCTQSTPITGESDVSADVSGLSPFTSYRYRLVAIESDGQGFPSYGRERSVTTVPSGSPTVRQMTVSDVTTTSARLGATINPNFSATTYTVEYGVSTAYESRTASSEAIGGDGNDHSISVVVNGLTPGTDYDVRVVASNFSGTTSGAATFTTEGGSATTSTEANAGNHSSRGVPSGGNCKKLASKARAARQRAREARLRAKRTPGSTALKAHAKRIARKARVLTRKATACEDEKASR
jgi:phosphodiesterase/alkaline phosphatase D-like protein